MLSGRRSSTIAGSIDASISMLIVRSKTFLALACFVALCGGRRINMETKGIHGLSQAKAYASLQALASHLVAISPAPNTFSLEGPGAHVGPGRASPSYMSEDAAQTTPEPMTYEQLAASCLDEDCPAQKVGKLIEELERVQAWDREQDADAEGNDSQGKNLAKIVRRLKKIGFSKRNLDLLMKETKEQQIAMARAIGLVQLFWPVGDSQEDPKAIVEEVIEKDCPNAMVEELISKLKSLEDSPSPSIEALESTFEATKKKREWMKDFVEVIVEASK